MNLAALSIRWLVFSVWMAVVVAMPFCAPAVALASVPSAPSQSETARCPCGDNCHCLVCGCDNARSEEKQTPSPVKTDSRELGVFNAVAAFATVSLADKGNPFRCSTSAIARDVEPAPTLVTQCICLRV
jgi:hypothetical protein